MPIVYPPGRVWPRCIYRDRFAKSALAFAELGRRDLLAELATPRGVATKEDAKLFGIARYDAPHTAARQKKDALGVGAIVGDIDGLYDAEKLAKGFSTLRDAGFAAVGYPSFSATVEAPRWRVVILLERDIAVSEYESAWAGANAIFGGIFDPAAKDATRISYLFSHSYGARPIAGPIVIGGAA